MSKLYFILLFIASFFLNLLGYGQSDEVVLISETFYKVPLVKALKKLKKKYKVKFAYDHKLLSHYKVTHTIHELPVAEAMELLLDGTSLRCKVAEQGVIILPPVQEKTFPISARIKINKTLSIRGIIKDSQTGETLPFANMRVLGVDVGTTSNVDGFFSLLRLPSESAIIEITYLGYVTKLVTLQDHDIKDLLVINLTSKAEVLDELVVEEKKSDMIYNGDNIGQISMNPSRLLSLPSLGEVDIFRTLQYLPGISGTDETSAGLVIRGSTPDQNLILFDGFSVYHIDHFFGIFSAFNSNAIKNIQIYKGAFESKYGGRASSVIDITGKTGNMNRLSYGFGVNLISANAVLELPLGKKLSLFMAGRRSHTDILQTGLYREIFDKVILENRDIISNLREAEFEDIEPAFNFYDLNGKLTFRPSSRDVLSLSYYSGRDNLDIDANQQFSYRTIDETSNIGFRANVDWQVDDYSNWGNDGTSLRWGRQWSQNFYSNINMAYSEYRLQQDNFEKLLFSIPVLEIDTLLRDRTQRIRNSLTDISLRWDNQLKIGKKSELAFGSLYTKNEIDFQFSINGESADSFSDRGEQLTFYVQNTFYPFDNLGITFGIRNNHYDVIGKDFVEPRASVNYQLSKKVKLKAAWGKHHQFINRILFEENLYDVNSSFWLLADGNNIPHVVSEHLVGGLSYESDDWLIDVEAYRKDTEGITDFFPDLKVTDGEDKLVNVFLAGNSVATGVDFLIQKKTGKHTGWLSYSLSKVENSFPDLNGGRPFAASQDQRHELKLINMMSVGKWDLSSTWVYGSGKPFSDPGKGSPLVTLDSLNTYYVAVDNINTERLPSYHRLDLAAAYNFNLGKGKAQFGLSIYNVYGRKNVKYKRFSTLDIDEITNETSTGDRQPVYIASDVLLLGFTPNFFFNFRF